MPSVPSNDTNVPATMIGEKAAEMIAKDNGVKLMEFVGNEA
jgi:choline dehydrogenase-like flavoprotein